MQGTSNVFIKQVLDIISKYWFKVNFNELLLIGVEVFIEIDNELLELTIWLVCVIDRIQLHYIC